MLTLDTPIQFVKGVGPVRAAQFEGLGIRTLADLVEHFPFRYQVTPRSQPIGTLKLGETATVIGGLRNVRRSPGDVRPSISATVEDGTGRCRVRWFHSPYLHDKLAHGGTIRLTGRVEQYGKLAEFVNPQFALIDDASQAFQRDQESYQPVYPATAALSTNFISGLIRRVLPEVVDQIPDWLPADIRKARGLPPRPTAVARYHQPTGSNDLPIARRRLAYDELILPQLAIQLRRRYSATKLTAEPLPVNDEIDRRIRNRFPFALTAEQDRCIVEIVSDLGKDRPMNRLLQGDVGSGKTAVALYAALVAIANRRQVLFLAPTEILAQQHHDKVNGYLRGSQVQIGFLRGAMPARQRSTLLAQTASGALDFLIGTHAVLQKDVTFSRLGLVIVDEQHRFGVGHRATAKGKAKEKSPHTLVMSATPIPRTLAMTLFGDLDISTITSLPPGRAEIHTRFVHSEPEAWTLVRQRVEAGEQAFIVYPRINETECGTGFQPVSRQGEGMTSKAAVAEAERLAAGPLSGIPLALLHGRMSSAEKDAVMGRFARGQTKVLVATTVVEVGIDVPNATVMVIQDAERYGLSQLHQMRGRIGRGSKPSYCLLLTRKRDEASLARLRILTQTRDGFRIAEEDLRLRGPGEFLGTRQHGFPDLKVADLLTDGDLLREAQHDAGAMVRSDPRLTAPEHALLRRELLRRFAGMIPFIDVA